MESGATSITPVRAQSTAVVSSPGDEGPFVRMTLGEHLAELRTRLLRAIYGLLLASALALMLGRGILQVLIRPAAVAMEQNGLPPTLLALDPAETMFVYLKTCLMVGLILSAPYGLWQLWGFIAGGLYPHEKRYVRLFAPVSLTLFTVGVSFFYFVVLPVMLFFLISFTTTIPMPDTALTWSERLLYGDSTAAPAPATQPDVSSRLEVLDVIPPREHWTPGRMWFNRQDRLLQMVGADGQIYSAAVTAAEHRNIVDSPYRLSEYLSFVTLFALAFGLVFQLPLLVMFLVLAGVVQADQLGRARKFIVLGIFIIAAVATPTTDMLGMALMAVPMLVLFEGGLLAARMLQQQRVRESAAAARGA